MRRVAAVPCFPRACEVYFLRVGTQVQIEIFENCPVFIGDARQIQSMPKEPGRSLHYPGRWAVGVEMMDLVTPFVWAIYW